MASHWTNAGLKRVVDRAAGTIDLIADANIKVMLLSSAYVPNKDHEFIADIVASEMAGTGYVGGFAGSGRKTLAGKTWTKDNTLDEVRFDATNPAWSGALFGTVAYAALVKEDTSDALSPVIAILDVGGVQTAGGTFTLDFGTYALRLRA
jgi:hypothetical protein